MKIIAVTLIAFLLSSPLSTGAGNKATDEIFRDGFESGDFAAWNRETRRVLFLGNSYTAFNNLPRVLEALGASPRSSLQFETDRVTPGGARWETHAGNATSLSAIDQGWDFVVLQDQSLQPVSSPLTLKEAAETLDSRIRNAGGSTVLFMTWPRAFHNLTTQHNYPLYYNHHGEHLGAQVAPVGQAWVRSLRLDPDLRLHQEDDSHPNVNGTYLTACVFFASLTGQSPLGLPDGGLNLSNAVRNRLQTIAWETVQSTRPPPPPLAVRRRLSAAAVEDSFLPSGWTLGDVEGPWGHPRGATHFDGTQFVSIPWSAAVLPTQQITFSLWVHRPDWTAPTPAREFLVSNPTAFGLYQDGTLLHASVQTLPSGNVYATFDVSGLDPGWHHFAVTYDGAKVVLWQDRVEVATAPAMGDLSPGSASLAFSSLVLGSEGLYPGPTVASAGFTNGALADFQLFHQVLDGEEIAALAAAP